MGDFHHTIVISVGGDDHLTPLILAASAGDHRARGHPEPGVEGTMLMACGLLLLRHRIDDGGLLLGMVRA